LENHHKHPLIIDCFAAVDRTRDVLFESPYANAGVLRLNKRTPDEGARSLVELTLERCFGCRLFPPSPIDPPEPLR
jgi:hypothetical protein